VLLSVSLQLRTNKNISILKYYSYFQDSFKKSGTMQEILKSTPLNFDESFLYINFIKSSKEGRYISVEQTIRENDAKQK